MTSPPTTRPRPAGIEDTHARMLRRAASPDHGRWLAHVASTRGCVRPVRLTGALHTVEQATGRIVATRHTATDLPDGVIYVPCGDRRASVCPACAETYRADTYQLIRAGLVGGKGVPASVTGHPVVFATLTAPSFGPVHTRSVNPSTGKVRPCRMRRDITLCPHGRQLAVHQAAHRGRPSPGAADLPGLLRPRRTRRLERLGRGTVAPHHDHADPSATASRARPRDQAAGLLRQGRRIPTPRRRALPRPHPPRPGRPRRPGRRPAASRRHHRGRARRSSSPTPSPPPGS